jgi:hypothetical protein
MSNGCALVVVNCVLIRFPIIPCNPKLILKNPIVTNDKTLVHNGSPRSFAMLGDPLFHMVNAAAMVNSD